MTDGQKEGRKEGRTDRRADLRTGGRMDGRMDGCGATAAGAICDFAFVMVEGAWYATLRWWGGGARSGCSGYISLWLVSVVPCSKGFVNPPVAPSCCPTSCRYARSRAPGSAHVCRVGRDQSHGAGLLEDGRKLRWKLGWMDKTMDKRPCCAGASSYMQLFGYAVPRKL
eukprot:365137-Chlamydomonas_euryale.AAC.2